MKHAIVVLILLAAILAVPGCKKKAADTSAAATAGSSSAAGVSDVSNVQERPDKAPNFSWTDSTGKQIDFASFSGKVNLVNFWATWCGPCKHEMPDLIALNTEYASKGVKFLGISSDVGTNVVADVKSYVAEHGINYQIVVANDDLKQYFGNVNMLPTTFIVDQDGKILKTMIGAKSKQDFAATLDEYLK